MARRYRSSNSAVADLAGLIWIGIAIAIFDYVKDFSDKYPYAGPIIVAIASVLIALAIVLRIRRFIRDRLAHKAYTIASIDSMGGVEFEHYLAKLLRSRGYTNVSVTEKYDLGVDIVAKKDGITWGIQAKRYKSSVKADAIRQVYTGLNRYKCDRAMVVTNSTYSRPARELANDTGTVLVGREALKEWVLEFSRS